MDHSRLNLRWNNHTDTFVSKLDEFRLQELYCDATIACDGRVYPVHKVVLSACSDFFASIFASTRCQNPVVVLQDVGKRELENLLIYMYRGEVHVLQDDLPVFIKVAESLHVKGLAVPHVDNCQEQQAEKRYHKSYSGFPNESHYSGSNLGVTLPQVQPYVSKILNPNLHSHRILQPSPQDERLLFTPRRPGEGNIKRRSHEMEYSVQSEFQQFHVMENISPLREKETSLKAKQKTDIQQQEKLDEFQKTHSRDTGHEMQLPSTSEHNGRTSLTDHDPALLNSDNSIYNPSSNSELNVRPSVFSEAEVQNDTSHESNSQKLCKAYLSEKSNSSEHKSKLNSVAGSSLHKDTSTEYHSSQNNGFLSSSLNGTFQNLVSEETQIKCEPEDYPMDGYESPSLCISEDFDNSKDDGSDSFSLKIAEEPDQHEEISYTENSKENRLELEQKILEPLSKEASPGREPVIATPTGLPPSQLRRELLRPIHHKAKPQSIPHPVIAPREAERLLREPPPLMKIDPKIPILVNEDEKSTRKIEENAHSSHLLVKVPPSYHSQSSPPTQFSLHIHNQHLGSVLVNGGIPLPETPPHIHRLTFPQNDGPLNLSGQKSPTESIDERDDPSDPFLGKIITNRRKRLRGPKSWEFLVRLLKDPTTNPFLIRWENEESGVFRLVQPAAIAQRWGRRTGKHASECLSYENFARGLRYHYATGALQPVSERSFVYRFGPKALKALKQCDSASFPYL